MIAQKVLRQFEIGVPLQYLLFQFSEKAKAFAAIATAKELLCANSYSLSAISNMRAAIA